MLRYRRGWEISDVTAKLATEHGVQIANGTVRSIETGWRNASARVLAALAAVFDVKVDDLLVLSDTPVPRKRKARR